MKIHIQTLFSFRASESFVDTTTQYAKLTGVSRSEYARQAIEEKNRRILEQRIHMLSNQLLAQSLAINESLDDTLSDGLHG